MLAFIMPRNTRRIHN